MFTGIIEEIGTLRQIRQSPRSCQIEIEAKRILEDIRIGDSIAVSGACLTVISYTPAGFTADVSPETLRRTTLGQLKLGDMVNLERAMAANGRFGGHFVAGHVDGTGKICSKRPEGNATVLQIAIPPEPLRYVVKKGSVAVDGVSLTVVAVTQADFTVSLIPHTIAETTLLYACVGKRVNIETDILGKYVEKLMEPTQKGITLSFLRENGF